MESAALREGLLRYADATDELILLMVMLLMSRYY